MAKVFRIHKDGKDTITDWKKTEQYNTGVISKITDPNGASAKYEITSIPSPFARIDLVKTAFAEVVKSGNLDGDTIFHKMVSDSLDVGEIFFNYTNYQDKFEIIHWDAKTDLKYLIDSSNERHRNLGNTLEMFLKQDAKSYNFDKLEGIYFLRYKGTGMKSQMDIVGATSPSTLFFSNANDLTHISQHVVFGNDYVFDNNYRSLHKRDFNFIKYLFLLQKENTAFAIDFPELYSYFELVFNNLEDEQKIEIGNLDPIRENEYARIIVDGASFVEVIGYPLHLKPTDIHFSSDFEVDSNIYKGVKPLILPIKRGTKYNDYKYTTQSWGSKNEAPMQDKTKWQDRKLPYVNTPYPYLTISDFLEESIIKMPFEINDKSFFDGNIDDAKNNSFLLPIKELFFDFFSTEDLIKVLPSGEKMFELVYIAGGGIKATIRIPIKKGFIEYSRIYLEQADMSNNVGSIIRNAFGLGLFPNLKFDDNISAHYRVGLYNSDNEKINLFFKDNKYELNSNHIVRKNIQGEISVETYVINNNFDRIIVDINSNKGIIIPLFCKSNGMANFTFAADFGTTNTHIEYRVDENPTKPFDITDSDIQLHTLHKSYIAHNDIKMAFTHYMIPKTIEANSEYSYPMRTVLSKSKSIDFLQPLYALASTNIPFAYEKIPVPLHNDISTDLKWLTTQPKEIELYLENIVLLLRNKVLYNNGNITTTKIIWFYPASMNEAQVNRINNIWTKLYKKYFGENTANLVMMSESTAPYNYYAHSQGANPNTVAVDIGGETTDIYVVEDSEPKLLSSFRFASNSIFGDGYNLNPSKNGFVQRYYNLFSNTLKANNLNALKDVLDKIVSNQKSTEIISFFFSLEQNKEVLEKNIEELNFSEKLNSDNELKYVFVIFYAAVFYYIAKTMKVKGLAMPNSIVFSGNGSKSLKVVSTNESTLSEFIKYIFEGVYGVKYDENSDLQLILEENPKQATSKGGVLKPFSQKMASIEAIKTSLSGADMETLVESSNINNIDKNAIVEQVNNFIDFIFKLDENNNNFFVKNIGLDAGIRNKVMKVCKKNVEQYLSTGINIRKEELSNLGDQLNIDETLFFFPLIGVLNNLAYQIVN